VFDGLVGIAPAAGAVWFLVDRVSEGIDARTIGWILLLLPVALIFGTMGVIELMMVFGPHELRIEADELVFLDRSLPEGQLRIPRSAVLAVEITTEQALVSPAEGAIRRLLYAMRFRHRNAADPDLSKQVETVRLSEATRPNLAILLKERLEWRSRHHVRDLLNPSRFVSRRGWRVVADIELAAQARSLFASWDVLRPFTAADLEGRKRTPEELRRLRHRSVLYTLGLVTLVAADVAVGTLFVMFG
jgi:hypothetical protein